MLALRYSSVAGARTMFAIAMISALAVLSGVSLLLWAGLLCVTRSSMTTAEREPLSRRHIPITVFSLVLPNFHHHDARPDPVLSAAVISGLMSVGLFVSSSPIHPEPDVTAAIQSLTAPSAVRGLGATQPFASLACWSAARLNPSRVPAGRAPSHPID